MAAEVYLDLINGATAMHHIQSGWTITRLAVVIGLETPLGGWTTGKLLDAAEDVLIAVVGDRGTPCPDIPVPNYLEQFVPEIVSPDVVKYRIVYKGFPRPRYELDGTLSQVESNKDSSGNLIVLSYTYPSGYTLNPVNAGKYVEQGGMISRPIPEMSFTVRFTIIGGNVGLGAWNATEMATWFCDKYMGKVNSNEYWIGKVKGEPRQWLVDKVRGVSQDGGVTYEMQMTFHYRRTTWDQLVVFINPDDGKPPPDLLADRGSSGAPPGYKMVTVPEEVELPTFVFGPN